MSGYEFTMGSGGVPVGDYAAEFAGAEDFVSENDRGYGPAITLKFDVLTGEHAGMTATRVASKKLSPKSTLNKMAVCLRGGPLATGEVFRIADYIGVRGRILVEATDDGKGTRVATFIKEAQAPPPQSPPPQAPPPAEDPDDF